MSRTPAIQWMVTQGNWIPMTGKKAVISSANMVADIDQWNPRAPALWRRIFSGRSFASLSSISPVPTFFGTMSAWPTTKTAPTMTAAQIRSHETPIGTFSPQGFSARRRNSMDYRFLLVAARRYAASRIDRFTRLRVSAIL